MNHIYRSLWSAALNTWIAVSENTAGKTKNSTARHRVITAGLLVYAANSWGLPTGEQLIAGQANVSVPNAGQMQIQQTTPQAILNWQGFSIQPHEIVSIQQPSINAILLNRVIGADASVIQGQLSANGQVYLINPNGVLFSHTAQVDVGGLIASTHGISNADFLNGNYHFSEINNAGLVTNQGTITVPTGGVVALIGSQVSNSGTIITPQGTTALAAGKTIDLDFQGDGLMAVSVSEAALNAQLENKGAILADGGRVVLTAQAAGDLINSVVNQTGIVQAKSLVQRNGEIILQGGDNGITEVSGSLDVSGQVAGGKINVTGKDVKLDTNANLVAQALESGKAGTILVFGDMKNGSLNVAGKLDASAPKNGDGGFIETSAAQVNVANSVKVSTHAPQGKTGEWLIDPTDFIITDGTPYSTTLATTSVTLQTNPVGAENGDLFLNSPITWLSDNILTLDAHRNININASIDSNNLGWVILNAGGSIIDGTGTGGSADIIANKLEITAGAGISVDTNVSQLKSVNTSTSNGSRLNNFGTTPLTILSLADASMGGTLSGIQLTSGGNITVSGSITTASEFKLDAGGVINAIGAVNVNGIFNLNSGRWTQVASSLPSFYAKDFRFGINAVFTRALGGDGSSAANPYQITDVYGLQGMNSEEVSSPGCICEHYQLSNAIDATGTSTWNNGEGFVPVGRNAIRFLGSFDGQNFTITGLTINRPTTDYVGLFGVTGLGSAISNIGLVGGSNRGRDYVGGLVGRNEQNTINNSYTTGNITGRSFVGGLTGGNVNANINNSYATGNVTGSVNYAGGLTGTNASTSNISSSYATGNVTGVDNVGGLVGASNSTITSAYATGSVTASSSVGGLIGFNESNVSDSYATGNVTNNGSGLNTGGLVGWNNGVLNRTYATGNVSGFTKTGGLIGYQVGTTNNSYATGNVAVPAAYFSTGGLIGQNNGGAVNNTYATGNVTGGTDVGGLVGLGSAGTITNSFWNTETSGQNIGMNGAASSGLTGLTTAQMQQLATFTAAGWDITDTGGSTTATWRIYEGNTYPLLRSFLTPLTVTGNSVTKVYNGLSDAPLSAASYSVAGADTSGHLFNLTNPYGTAAINVGTYPLNGLYSDQQGYDISSSGTLTINPYPVDLTATRSYDGTVAIAANAATFGTLPNGETLSLTGTASVTDKNVGANKPFSTPFVLANGSGLANNYTFAGGSQTVTITPAALTLNAVSDTKVYDGTTTSTAVPTFTGLQTGDTLTALSQSFISPNVLGTNNSTLEVNSNYQLNDGNAGNNYTITRNTAFGTISAVPLNVISLNGTRVYDGTTEVAASIFTLSGLKNNEDLTLSGVGTIASKNVGTYNSLNLGTLALGNGVVGLASNYTFAGGSQTVTITPAALTLNAVSDTKVYDGTTVSTTVPTFTGLKTGDTLTGLTQSFASKNVAGLNNSALQLIDNYSISDGNGGANYTVSINSAQGTITPAILTINAVTDSKIYDGTTVSSAVPTFIGLKTGDTLTGLNQTFANKNVLGLNQSVLNSNYALNDGNGGANYTVSSSSAQGTITPAILNLSAVSDTKVYDGTTVSTAIPTFSGLKTGDTLTGLTQSFTNPNVLGTNGSTLAVNPNYFLNDGNAGNNYSFNITTALGTISAVLLNAISLNGTRVYDGTTAVAANSFTLTGLKNNDDLTLSGVGSVASKNVGTYNSLNFGTLALGNGVVGLASNYTFAGGSQTVTITPAALTLNATPNSKVYDGTTLSMAVPTATGLQIGDTLTGLTQAFTSKDVAGTNGSLLLASNNYLLNDGNAGRNYVVSRNSATGTITPATLTYIANPVVSNNTATPVFTGTVTGFVAGESLSNATSGTALFSSFANFNQTGSAAINGSGLTANNYLFTQAASNATALTLIAAPVALPEPIPPAPAPISVPAPAPIPEPAEKPAEQSVNLQPQLVSLQATPIPPVPNHFVNLTDKAEQANHTNDTANNTAIADSTNEFINNPINPTNETVVTNNAPEVVNNLAEQTSTNSVDGPCSSGSCNQQLVIPTLKVKSNAGRVERLELSANRRFLSLLLEDGTVRVWDFAAGLQRNIITPNNQALTDISTPDNKGLLISVASNAGVGTYEVISSSADDRRTIQLDKTNHFTTSADGRLLLVNQGDGLLSLWDNNRNKLQWQLTYRRGKVVNLAIDANKRYGAVLSHQAGNYLLPANLKLKKLIDAVDVVDLRTGKLIKTLPNVGEEVVYMQFKNQDTLQIGLASGEMMDWSLTTGQKNTVAQFAETIASVDVVGDKYAYLRKNGTVRVSDGQGHLQLSIQNKENPFQFAKLIESGEKLLTVLASGDIAIWDIASGKKIVRLFSNAKQGWIVMDAFGRFDGSDQAIENFSWLAAEEDIPLDSFSENYYEPGLLTSVLEDKNISLNKAIKAGISLPPKLNLQLAAQQEKTDTVAVQLDVYNRGGGIEKVRFYHNNKLLSDTNIQMTEETPDHRVFTLNILPSAGENSVKAVATNAMGIENKSAQLHFDGKTKAYTSHLRLLTVGVNKYSDPSLNLNYSVADANLIVQTLKDNAKVAFSKSLTDEKATKQRILAELKELSRGEQHDVLAIYLAGHGMVIGKEWYFLPHETKMQPTLKQIATAGITSTELSDVFKNSNIQHILLMVDSCHSGASTDAFSNLQNGQRYFTRQLSRSLGITVITATVKEQEAAELQSLGHGLFTYLLAEELKNKKTGSAITAHSIAASIAKSLPAFSQKMLGFTQDPAVYTTGNNFMLINEPKK